MLNAALTAVPTLTWSRDFDLETTLPGDDWDTAVDAAPAGALARRETLPPINPAYLENVATETAAILVGIARRLSGRVRGS